MSRLLEVSDVTVQFGGVKALDAVGFFVEKGEFVCLIGPNGAGKTTLLKAVTGIVKPLAARILLSGRAIEKMPTHRRMRLGLALTHQIVKPFSSMTVLDNVALAAGYVRFRHVIKALVSVSRTKQRAKAMDYLKMAGIEDQAEKRAAVLPLGVAKRLEVARALALEPKVLLLDEPLAGLNQAEAAQLADRIQSINKDGMTVVMIEHNLGEVLRVGRRLIVLDNGRKLAEGEPRQVMTDPAVREAYVGKGGSHADG